MKNGFFGFMHRFRNSQFADSPNRQRIARNSLWLLLDKMLRLVLGLVVGVMVARYLGPAEWGSLNFAIALVALVTPFATLGLERIVVRNLVREEESMPEILGTATALRFSGGGATFILAISLITLIRPEDSRSLWLVGIISAGLVLQSFDTIDYRFQSLVKSKYTVYARSTAFLIVSACKILLVFTGASLVVFAWAYLAEVAIASAVLLLIYVSTGGSLRSWRVTGTQAGGLLRDSLPLTLSAFLVITYMRIDQIMLGQILGDHEVGIYSTAVRLAEFWYFIPTILVVSSFPAIVESKTDGGELYYRRLQKVYDFLVRLAVIIALPVTFMSDLIINLLFGPGYAGAGPILSINIWAGVFVFFAVARGAWLVAENLQKYAVYYYMVGAAVNVMLNLVMIPALGGKGAALATLAAQFAMAYIAPLFFRKTRISTLMFNRSLFPYRMNSRRDY